MPNETLFVLIVAKCNVNKHYRLEGLNIESVLIVAKCNVNVHTASHPSDGYNVLIVAKCNVNLIKPGKSSEFFAWY